MWFSYFIENTFVSSTIIIEDLFFVEIRKMMMVNLYVKRDSRYLINFKDPIIIETSEANKLELILKLSIYSQQPARIQKPRENMAKVKK